MEMNQGRVVENFKGISNADQSPAAKAVPLATLMSGTAGHRENAGEEYTSGAHGSSTSGPWT